MTVTNPWRARLRAVLALAFLAGLTSTAAVGCGQDVASCSSVCGSDADCSSMCSDLETNCSDANASSDFQDLLTCLGNAGGTFGDVPPLCTSAQDTVDSTCGSSHTVR